ncbi:MAG: hypothetical protein KAK00_07260 [Nanoarchaeota archaeon]|nr:hypothetical protein [Nanoarchaeota archaeon]
MLEIELVLGQHRKHTLDSNSWIRYGLQQDIFLPHNISEPRNFATAADPFQYGDSKGYIKVEIEPGLIPGVEHTIAEYMTPDFKSFEGPWERDVLMEDEENIAFLRMKNLSLEEAIDKITSFALEVGIKVCEKPEP